MSGHVTESVSHWPYLPTLILIAGASIIHLPDWIPPLRPIRESIWKEPGGKQAQKL